MQKMQTNPQATSRYNGLTQGPIFVVGNSRSGTTMVSRVLGKHPRVFTLRETHFFEQLWSSADEERHISEDEAIPLAARLLCVQRDGYLNQGNLDRFYGEAKGLISSMQHEGLTPEEIFKTFLILEANRNSKVIPCDQTPHNVFYLREILDLFPEARVINLVRDPRNVLLSQKRKWKRRFLGAKDIPLKEAFRSWTNYHPITISKLWTASVRAAERHAHDNRVYSLRFEDLVDDPDGAVRTICEFAGLSFDRSMLEVPQIGSSSGLDDPERRGISRERAGNWRKGGLSPTEIFLCQKLTGALMRQHGYPLAWARPNPLRLCLSIVLFPIKTALALLLNLRRMRSIKETIRRRLS
jgi:omega-hydroxy-beta-dihydromenaquinone-9 sulfotransferase